MTVHEIGSSLILLARRQAMAKQVIASQRRLISTLRRNGRPTEAAEAALARYEAVRVLHDPWPDQLRTTYQALELFVPVPENGADEQVDRR